MNSKPRSIYFETEIICKETWLFAVPHLEKPLSVKKMMQQFPDFCQQFDGSSKECCLSWYYKLDKETGIFEFKNVETEAEVAEELGVHILETDITETPTGKQLTESEVSDFRDFVQDLRTGLEFLEKRPLNNIRKNNGGLMLWTRP